MRLVVAIGFVGSVLVACSSEGGSSAIDEASTQNPTYPTLGTRLEANQTIFTIVLENQDYVDVVGSSNAPYINSLIDKYGLATNYADSGVHPSLPNYLTMISGAPQYPGRQDLDPTRAPFPVAQPNLGAQLEAAGITWRSYQESMGTPCRLAASGTYAPKHDPFLYFTDIQLGASGLCASANVDYTSFSADLASGTYRYMWITPNLTDDGHNPQQQPAVGLKDADTWASTEIPKIMASSGYTNGGVIFITWDEAEGRHGHSHEQIPMIVISPRLVQQGFKSSKPYSHKSYLATVEDLLGLPRLATVASEPSMQEFLR
jgi:hypothetical protein